MANIAVLGGVAMGKILVIDDSILLHRTMHSIFNELCEVKTARNGLEALQLLSVEEFDLIFCDLLMPVLNGYEFLERIQEKEITTPVVILSADIQKQSVQRCLDLGAASFLRKPPDTEQILDLYRHHTRNKGEKAEGKPNGF